MRVSFDRSDGTGDGGISSFGGSQRDTEARREMVVVLIEPRMLIRECLARCLRHMDSGAVVVPFSTMEGWLEVAGSHPDADVVLLCVGEHGQIGTEIEQSLQPLSQMAVPPPVVVVSDGDDPTQILEALDKGAKGFIPTSVPLAVAIEAIRLVRAGGTFVPASSLMAARHVVEQSKGDVRRTRMFTEKQTAVVEALRKGKSNKIIAYELSMCESTVKVHVRNIMKKLKASNRTQVAYIYESLPLEQKHLAQALTLPLPIGITPIALPAHA